MKKRTSRDKEHKLSIERLRSQREPQPKAMMLPLLTRRLLVQKTESMNQVVKFEISLVEQLMQGSSPAGAKYRQIERDNSFQSHLGKYQQINDIRHVYTNLITRCSQVGKISCGILKVRHFRIMSRYSQKRGMVLGTGKGGKQENNKTAEQSFSEGGYLSQKGTGIKKITSRAYLNPKVNLNSSSSFIQILVGNIQKMIKHIKDPDSPKSSRQMDFQPVLQKHEMNTPDISRICHQRLHTTPESMTCDNYGLGEYTNKAREKREQLISVSTKLKQSKENIPKMIRFHTEYDTQVIIEPIKLKSKSKLSALGSLGSVSSLGSLSKRVSSRKKLVPKSKSPPLTLRAGLRLKLKK